MRLALPLCKLCTQILIEGISRSAHSDPQPTLQFIHISEPASEIVTSHRSASLKDALLLLP